MRLHRRTIPDRLWLAVLHLRKLLVPIKQGIGWDDRSDITQNGGLGHPIFSVHTKMPLKIANPEHELSDLCSPRIDFEAMEVGRSNRVAAELKKKIGRAHV